MRHPSRSDGHAAEHRGDPVADQREGVRVDAGRGHPLDLGQGRGRLGREPGERGAAGAHGWPPSTVSTEPVVYDERSLAR